MRNRITLAAATGALLMGLATSALMAGSASAAPASPSPSTPASSAAPTPTASTSTSTKPAQKSTTVTLNPSTVARGGSVLIGGGCQDSYGSKATAESTAFGKVTLNPMDGGPGARVTIGANVPLGKHAVNVRCADGATGSATLTVVAGQTRTKPVGGVETGGGGTATERPSLLWAGGLVPLAGLGVAIALLLRRARRA
jgi:hypothetical protein